MAAPANAKHYHTTSLNPPWGKVAKGRRFGTPIQKVQIYDVVDAAGSSGISAYEIATSTKIDIARIRFHLSELKRSGYIGVVGDPTTVSPHMNAQEAAFAAMLGLENALIAAARETAQSGGKISDEMERGFGKYQKVKELALRPGTSPEGRTALRIALKQLIDLVF